jgi:beta-galactosidase GanA
MPVTQVGWASSRCRLPLAYREHTRRIVEAMARRYGLHPGVVGWQIDNEFGDFYTLFASM